MKEICTFEDNRKISFNLEICFVPLPIARRQLCASKGPPKHRPDLHKLLWIKYLVLESNVCAQELPYTRC